MEFAESMLNQNLDSSARETFSLSETLMKSVDEYIKQRAYGRVDDVITIQET